MAIIRNKTASPIELSDLGGITLPAGVGSPPVYDLDLTLNEISADKIATSADLVTNLTTGDICFLDGQGFEMSISESLEAQASISSIVPAIFLQENGANVAGTPHSTINLGTNLSVTNEGNGKATIATTGGDSDNATFALEWRFSTSTTEADPGSGKLRYNNAIPASVTEIYIDDLTNAGVDASNILSALRAGDKFYVQQNDVATAAQLFTIVSVTDNTGWFTLGVTVDGAGVLPGNNKKCAVVLLIGVSARDKWASITPDSGGALVPDSDSDTLTIAGGTGIATVGTPGSDTLTINLTAGLNDLSDVDITGSPGPSEGNIIHYSGGQWVHTTIEAAAASKRMNSWTLLSGNLYYNDFAHNLNTTEISVYLYDTASDHEVRVEYTHIIDVNTLRVVVEGNAEDLTCNVITGAVGPPGPQGPPGGGLTAVIEDTTPQLGGNLDLNGNSVIVIGSPPTAISPVELSYLDGATSNIQAQLDGKAAATHEHTFRIPHTWAISGEIAVPSGDTDYIIPFFVSLASGQTAELVKARHRINSGTSVTAKLQKNGGDITGFTGISVTTTPTDTDPTDVTLSNNDMIALVVTAVAGTPQNMTFTIFIEYTQ